MVIVSFFLTKLSSAFYFISNFIHPSPMYLIPDINYGPVGPNYIPNINYGPPPPPPPGPIYVPNINDAPSGPSPIPIPMEIMYPLVPAEHYPKCVIGAGISGLNVANLLQKKGYTVHVFEKTGKVGGKILTYREGEEIKVEMGPVLYVPAHAALLKKIDEFQLTTIPFNESDSSLFDAKSGAIFPRQSLTATEIEQVGEAVKSYAGHWAMYEKDLQYGYVNASSDLFVSVSNWLDTRNLQAVKPFFVLLLTIEGYGALEDTPALYALKFIQPSILEGLATLNGSFLTVKEGLDIFAKKLAAPLSVFLNKEMAQISRKGDHQLLVMTDGNVRGYQNIYTQKCSSVILAFPPLISNVKNVIVDLTENEYNVLSNVKIHHYTSAAHQIPSLNQELYYHANPKGTGEVVAFAKQSSKALKNVYSSYSWIRGDFNSSPSAIDVWNIENQLEASLQKIDKNSKTFYRAAFEYFPHVATKALNNGFYKQFDSIQGKGGIYYATTLLTFENMNNALEMTEKFVEKYF